VTITALLAAREADATGIYTRSSALHAGAQDDVDWPIDCIAAPREDPVALSDALRHGRYVIGT
jgi:hypothetical protein